MNVIARIRSWFAGIFTWPDLNDDLDFDPAPAKPRVADLVKMPLSIGLPSFGVLFIKDGDGRSVVGIMFPPTGDGAGDDKKATLIAEMIVSAVNGVADRQHRQERERAALLQYGTPL